MSDFNTKSFLFRPRAAKFQSPPYAVSNEQDEIQVTPVRIEYPYFESDTTNIDSSVNDFTFLQLIIDLDTDTEPVNIYAVPNDDFTFTSLIIDAASQDADSANISTLPNDDYVFAIVIVDAETPDTELTNITSSIGDFTFV